MQLGRGRWDYAESGLMDRGHLRFFTRATIVSELTAAGLQIEAVSPIVPRLRNHLPVVERLPGRLATLVETLWQRLGRRRQELMAYQLVIVARPVS
jgi:hypothetical protein